MSEENKAGRDRVLQVYKESDEAEQAQEEVAATEGVAPEVTDAERVQIGDLSSVVGHPGFAVLEKAGTDLINNLKEQALTAQNIEQLASVAGQINGIRWTLGLPYLARKRLADIVSQKS
jgi:hypothetical protein